MLGWVVEAVGVTVFKRFPSVGVGSPHVCAPDTATHTFSISAKFCTMRPWSAYADSQVSVIIHEASHFLDTMATTDEQYYITPFLSAWGRSHPDLAINNADSIAGYVVDGD
nr:M35 family metallo-endopeptidase [Burkholderia multivorans]